MASSDLSVSAISSQKLENVQQKAQVLIAKSASDTQGDLAHQIISDATERSLTDGVGGKVNTVA